MRDDDEPNIVADRAGRVRVAATRRNDGQTDSRSISLQQLAPVTDAQLNHVASQPTDDRRAHLRPAIVIQSIIEQRTQYDRRRLIRGKRYVVACKRSVLYSSPETAS